MGMEHFANLEAPFVNVIGKGEYSLAPDFATSFSRKGADKASGSGMIEGPSPVAMDSEFLSKTNLPDIDALP